MPIGWKRSAVFGACFGLAAAVTLVAAAGLFSWYSSRPQSWDAGKIKGVSTSVSQTFDLDEQHKRFIASGFELVFVLKNTSRRDFTVPQNLRLFERSNKTGELKEVNAKFGHSFVVPAKDETEVNANVEYGCSGEDLETGKVFESDGPSCFKDAFGDVTGFVGFDDATHTRLNLPRPVFYAGSSQPKETSNGIAPDHGKPWERYGACEQAAKLVPLCKQDGIALEYAKSMADGWTVADPLPKMALPKGYNLDPGEASCRMVYEWDYYCRKQGMSK